MAIPRRSRGPLLLFTLGLALGITNAFAGDASTEAWLPVVGQTSGYGGRAFGTTVLIANTSGTGNHLELSFFAAQKPGAPPVTTSLEVRPWQPAQVAVGPGLVGTEGGAVGALLIHGSAPFVAQAHLFSRAAADPPESEVGTTINAIPATSAIGIGETTTLLAPMASGRYKIYAVETLGFPVNFSITPLDPAGAALPPRNLYLGAREQRSWTIEQLFGAQRGPVSALQLKVTNGSGRLIALGTDTNPLNQDLTAYEMSLPLKARNRIRAGELATYFVVALALVIIAILRTTKRTTVGD